MASNAWQFIGLPTDSGAISVRRADPDHPLDFFRGKNFQGQHLFMFRVRASPGDLNGLPNPAGIDVAVEKIDEQLWQLRLSLKDAQQADIFSVLCTNLMEATRGLKSGQDKAAVSIIIRRLERWHQLLKSGRSGILSESEQIGLFGELLFLRDVLLPRHSPAQAFTSWRGPYGDEQDFSIGHVLLEVKTQRLSSDRFVKISSAEQLDSGSGRIFLCHQTVTEGDVPDDRGFSLNGMVNEIISDAETIDAFSGDILRSALMEIGYEARPDYDTPVRALQNRDIFEVRDDFPCITTDMLRPGVRGVTYSLEISTCSPFLVTTNDLFGDAAND